MSINKEWNYKYSEENSPSKERFIEETVARVKEVGWRAAWEEARYVREMRRLTIEQRIREDAAERSGSPE